MSSGNSILITFPLLSQQTKGFYFKTVGYPTLVLLGRFSPFIAFYSYQSILVLLGYFRPFRAFQSFQILLVQYSFYIILLFSLIRQFQSFWSILVLLVNFGLLISESGNVTKFSNLANCARLALCEWVEEPDGSSKASMMVLNSILLPSQQKYHRYHLPKFKLSTFVATVPVPLDSSRYCILDLKSSL